MPVILQIAKSHEETQLLYAKVVQKWSEQTNHPYVFQPFNADSNSPPTPPDAAFSCSTFVSFRFTLTSLGVISAIQNQWKILTDLTFQGPEYNKHYFHGPHDSR